MPPAPDLVIIRPGRRVENRKTILSMRSLSLRPSTVAICILLHTPIEKNLTADTIFANWLSPYHLDFSWYCLDRIALARFLLLVLYRTTQIMAQPYTAFCTVWPYTVVLKSTLQRVNTQFIRTLCIAQSTNLIFLTSNEKKGVSMENLDSYFFTISVSFATFLLAQFCL